MTADAEPERDTCSTQNRARCSYLHP